MMYEILRFEPDPFDLMCSDCPVHEIQWWESVTLEELHNIHAEELAEDASMPDFMIEEMSNPTNPNFGEWLKQRIASGYIRIAA